MISFVLEKRKNTQRSEKCPLFTPLCVSKRDASIPNGKRYTLLCYGCDYHNVSFHILHVLSYRSSTLLSCISASVHRCYNAQNKRLLICLNLLYLHKTHAKIPSVASGLTDTACPLRAKLEKNKSTKTEREEIYEYFNQPRDHIGHRAVRTQPSEAERPARHAGRLYRRRSCRWYPHLRR